MEGPRPPFENEYPEVVRFVTRSLRPKSHWSVADEYPTAFNLANLNNIRVIFDENQVVSHALIKPLIIKTPLLLLKVAGIGSVVTADSHRQRGLSRKVLEECLRSAEAQGCDVALLWTEIPEFYQKFEFELAGTENIFTLDRPLGSASEGLTFRTGRHPLDSEQLFDLYQKHTVATLRSKEEIEKFLSIPNSQVYTAWNAAGSLLAYAVEGKGDDLAGHIHEWGGQLPDLVALFNEIREGTGRDSRLMVPGHAFNLIRHLDSQGVPRTEKFLGMIRILRPDLLCAKIKRLSRDLGIPDLIFEKQGDHFYIGCPGHVFRTDSSLDLVKLIFGPWAPQEVHPFDPDVTTRLNKIFPLPLWIWGWDSV